MITSAIKPISDYLAYYVNAKTEKCVIDTEEHNIIAMLNKKEFIKVSLGL